MLRRQLERRRYDVNPVRSCGLTPLAADGGACKRGGAPCERGRVCLEGACRGLPKLGEPCVLMCDGKDVFCNVVKGETQGVCEAKRAAGSACEHDGECKGYCAEKKCASLCGSG